MRSPYRLAAFLSAAGCCAALAGASAGGTEASRRALTACRPSDYSLTVIPARRVTRHGLVLDVGLAEDDVPSCSMPATFRLTIRTKSGAVVRSIHGNPAVWRRSGALAPWASFARAWRWVNWCGPQRRFRITATAGGEQVALRAQRPPPCTRRRARSQLGRSARPYSGGGSPAGMLPPGFQPPFSPSVIRTTNGWLVSNGRTLVAVYAGESGNDPTVGMFGIVRQDLEFGLETRRIISVGNVGTVQITNAPSGAGVETSAQHADIEFSSAAGRGVLHLATDTTELLPLP
jgi:hypothetical protein